MDGVLARVVVASGLARLAWWRPRVISACERGLVVAYRTREETTPWSELDAVIDVAPVLVQSRGRVLARLPGGSDDDEEVTALVAAIVARAGLEWVEAKKQRRLPRMAVRPAVASTLRQ
jgi:hypothetical protein